MEEFTVRAAPSVATRKHSVFKLHKDDDVSWTEAKMRRENEFQPWQIKIGSSRTARRYKAIKEGGVGDNASYFVFYKPKDKGDTYEVCPIDEWYNISATQRYKTLTAEEAEQKFEQRHKMLNLFSVMHLKKNGEAEEGGSGYDRKAFKVSELDDWDGSGDDEGGEDEGEDGSETKNKIRRKKAKEEPDDAPEEAKEDSDEGDYEQREVDYMSDSSSSSSDSAEAKDATDVKGIAEEEALRELLSTDDEEEGESVQQNRSKFNDPNALGTVEFKNHDDDGSEDSSDSDDYDVDDEKMDSMFSKKGLPTQLSVVKQEVKQEPDSASSTQINPNKRKPASATTSQPPKKICTDTSPPNSEEKMVEDLVKKYLSRKPMTLKALLKDIKSKLKRTNKSTPEMDNKLLPTIAAIMKKLSPDRQKISDVLYFSIRS